MPYYAIANGRKAGVVLNWKECESRVSGYSNSSFRKFSSQAEASAFVLSNAPSTKPSSSNSHQSSSGGSYSSTKSTTSKTSTTKNSGTQHVYVDGASRGNGKVQHPKSGYGVYYGEGDKRNASVPLSKVDQKPGSNQRAELHAVNHALNDISKDVSKGNATKGYTIHTDSQYAIKATGECGDKWRSNGWRTNSGNPVSNQDLIQKTTAKLENVNKAFEAKNLPPVNIKHVAGHSGNHGNVMADRLANKGADND